MLKTYLVIEVALTVIIMVAALTGHVEHLQYLTFKGWRKSFGSVYPTDFAAHILYIAIVLFVVFMIMLTYNMHQLKMYNCRVCLMLLSIIALHSFMEQHLLELAYNPFILMTFANLSNIENKTEKKKCIEKKTLNGSNI